MISINDAEYNFYREMGLNGALNDMRYQYGKGQPSYEFLRGEGYDGALNDMILTYYTKSAGVPSLFSNGEQGFWLDPSDFSTMYQDAAGTIPVTAVEQPVERILDKSGRGNHASQATTTKRPIYSRRVNLLTKTNAVFSEGPWQGSGTTASGSRITATAANSNHIRYQPYAHAPNVPVRYRVQVAKKIGFGFFQLCHSNATRVKCTVNLETGEFVVLTSDGANAVVTVTDTGTGRWEITITSSSSIAIGTGYFNMGPTTSLDGAVNAYQEPVFTGTGEYIDVYEPDLRLATAAHLPYQRVNTDIDYDTVGFPHRIQYDLVDDALTATFPSALGSNCTVARSIPGVGAQILTAQTIGASFTENTTSCGVIVIDRALTAHETAAVTAYLNGKAGV